MATVNRGVREHLRRVVNTERQRTARVLVRLRAAGALLYLGVTAWLGLVDLQADWLATLPLCAAYTAIAVAVALVAERSALVLRYAGVAIGVLDVPVLTWMTLIAIPDMTRPEYLLGSLVPTSLTLIVLSALALDFVAITLATVASFVATVVLILAVRAPVTELITPLISVTGTGALSLFLVSRLRSLVEESRRKDFAGKYLLGERIGAGGMAEVFEATYSPEGGFERRVAVKRVLPAYAGDETFVQLFRREAELGAQLAHPNLVQVLDFGRHLDSWFLAMEYVDGITLSSLLRARGASVPVEAGLFVMTEIAEGLAYIHEKPAKDGASVGLVHRDLNPPNVLLSRQGEVKISDFGVARWRDTPGLTHTGTVRGKLAYMAPEQIDGGPPTPAWDLFAFGVLSWELLTGGRLFTADNDTQLLDRLLRAELAAPSTVRPEVPAEVDTLVLGLLERDARRRIASARVVSERLRSLTGVHAPFPGGRAALRQAIELVGPTTPAQAPSGDEPARADPEAPTATVERTLPS